MPGAPKSKSECLGVDKEITMDQETAGNGESTREDSRPLEREVFVRQVDDRSLPALQVLSQQQAAVDAAAPSRLFVP